MLGHRYAVKTVRALHSTASVRDKYELRAARISFDVFREARYIRLVKSCLDLIKYAERRWIYLKHRKEERNGDECLLSARKLHKVLDDLSGRCGFYLNAAVENVLGIGKLKLGLAAAEKLAEYSVKVFIYLVEGLDERGLHLGIELSDYLFKLRL